MDKAGTNERFAICHGPDQMRDPLRAKLTVSEAKSKVIPIRSPCEIINIQQGAYAAAICIPAPLFGTFPKPLGCVESIITPLPREYPRASGLFPDVNNERARERKCEKKGVT